MESDKDLILYSMIGIEEIVYNTRTQYKKNTDDRELVRQLRAIKEFTTRLLDEREDTLSLI